MQSKLNKIVFVIFVFISYLINAQEYEWEYFNSDTTVHGWISSINIDTEGTKWIGTYGNGLAKYNNEVWTIYNDTNSILPSSLCWDVNTDGEGATWIGCGTDNGGLVKIDGEDWEVFTTNNSGLPNNQVHSITFDENGNKWIGTLEGGMTAFNDTTWINYNTQNSDIPSNEILCVAIDSENKKWVGTWHHGFAIFDGIKWIVYNIDNSPLPHNTVIDIEIDSDKNMWIATEGGGLVKLVDSTWTIYNTTNSGLESDDLIAIEFDKYGKLWIGTTRGGVSVFNGDNWINLAKDEGLNDHSALCIAFENEDVWIGTWGRGVSVLKNGVNIVSVKEESAVLPKEYLLSQNYPNPFNPTTTISYQIPNDGFVDLVVYNTLGQVVLTLVNEHQISGKYSVQFNANNLPSGVYFYKIESDNFTKVNKMLLLR